MGGLHFRLVAAAALALTSGCKGEVYPQYTGTFHLVDAKGIGMDGDEAPRLLRVTGHMSYAGGSFVHYLEFEAPDVPENAGRATGHFVVSLTGLLNQGSTQIMADGQAHHGGVEALPDSRIEDGGAYCYREASYRFRLDENATYPAPAVLGRVYRGKTNSGGYQVSLPPSEVSRAPIDEVARSEWVEVADAVGGVQLTLVLERRARTVMLGCSEKNPLTDGSKSTRLTLVYQAPEWHEDRDVRKGAAHYLPPSEHQNRVATHRFFQPLFGNPPVYGVDR
jgi:hypothetical protein